jgi:NAD(P)H-dependent flavin oxidoreductase YrpB (nitropropane dioxygenase family)
MVLRTKLTSEYRCACPIVQAGMAFVGSTPELAIAVCRAGAIGSLAAAMLPTDALRSFIRAIRAATAAPFHVNFITFLARREQIDVCIEEGVPIVSFHWGPPSPRFIDALHGAGAKVWEQVGSIEAARRAIDGGIDLIVAQGTEAGGHNLGSLPSMALVPAIVDAVAPAPVLAAGGIADGRGLVAALALGAAGVWIGTRLVASTEAHARQDYKLRLIKAHGTDTRLSSLFGPEMAHFNPMRVLANRVVREFEGREDQRPADTSNEPAIGTAELLGQTLTLRRFSSFVPMATTSGDLEEMPLLAGQGVGLIHAIEAAETIVRSMMVEAERIVLGLGNQAPD